MVLLCKLNFSLFLWLIKTKKFHMNFIFEVLEKNVLLTNMIKKKIFFFLLSSRSSYVSFFFFCFQQVSSTEHYGFIDTFNNSGQYITSVYVAEQKNYVLWNVALVPQLGCSISLHFNGFQFMLFIIVKSLPLALLYFNRRFFFFFFTVKIRWNEQFCYIGTVMVEISKR